MSGKLTIQKIDDSPIVLKQAGKKTLKTFPRGVLKKTSKLNLKGVKDPAKSPALKKGMRKHTLKMLTDKGLNKQRKTMRNKLKNLDSKKVHEIAEKSGLHLSSNTPPGIAREILSNAVSAGFVSM
jgi:hypothetical protein